MTDDDSLARILASLPGSVELPAGAGKTELISRLAERTAQSSGRTLILTHTHAGIDVIRRRLRRHGVPSASFSIRTLDSWSFDLISRMPQLSGMAVDEEPDWTLSSNYHSAARRAVLAASISRMLRASYELVLVDEYQDCQIWQHELIASIAEVVPTAVLGDRMQGLFYFKSSVPVDWDAEVLRAFPDIEYEAKPWRWSSKNADLGEWLIEARTSLLHGSGIDLGRAPVKLMPSESGLTPYFGTPRHPDTTVAISKWPRNAAILARQLGGSFTMIEEIEGRHLREFARVVDGQTNADIAAGTAEFGTNCGFGVADVISAAQRRQLAAGKALKLQGADPAEKAVIAAVNGLLNDASPSKVRAALLTTAALPKFRLFRREAWFGVLEALRLCETTEDLTVLDAVVSIRTRLSRSGRRPESRIVGRPLLIKGLEFDHAVLGEPGEYNAHELYVCLSRASSTLTVINNTGLLSPARPLRPE